MNVQRSNSAQAGHTLLEFAIAAALALVVIAGAFVAYRAQRVVWTQAADAARIGEAGRSALTLIGDQIQMAGFVPAGMAAGTIAVPLAGCSAARPMGPPGVPDCRALAGGSDGLTLQYVGDLWSTWPSAARQVTDCVGQGVGERPAPVVNRYYAHTAEAGREPELYCHGSGNTAAQPLVAGIERLHLRYWLAGAGQAVAASAVEPEQWPTVVAVELCVLARGAPTGRAVRYTGCDGATVMAVDGRARSAFRRYVALRNGPTATEEGV